MAPPKITKSKVKPIPFPADDPNFDELVKHTHELMHSHVGDLHDLEAAIGFMFVGYYYGWRVLHIIHSKRTVNKYESLLGIDVKEAFPAEGPYVHRSQGYMMFEKITNFWKAINGDIPVEGEKRDRTLVA